MAESKINIKDKLESIKWTEKKFLKKKGYFWMLTFLILFLIIAIILDNKYILPSYIRWIALSFSIASVGFIINRIWLSPSKAFTTKRAMDELENRKQDKQQLLRTAHEIELKASKTNLLEKTVLAEANERIKDNDDARDPWLKYKRYWKFTKIAGILFLIIALLNNSVGTGLVRTLLPFSDLHYTRISTHSSNEFYPENTINVDIITNGKTAKNAILYTKEDGSDWEQKTIEINHQRHVKIGISNPKKSFEYYVAMGDGKSATKHLEMIAPPVVSAVLAEIKAPDYMKKGIIKHPNGNIKAYQGSDIAIEFTISRTMKEAYIILPNKQKEKMTINNKTLQYSFPKLDTLSGEYSIYGVDNLDTELQMHQYKIQILKDKLPTIKLINPAKDIELTPLTEIPIVIHVQDDIGISEVGLSLKVDGKEKEIAHFNITDSIVLDCNKISKLALENFDVTINSNVRMYAWAKDKNPNHNKRAVTILRGLDIRPFRRFYKKPESIFSPPSGSSKPNKVIMGLEKIIQIQRNVLSKTFKYAEEGGAFSENIKLSETEDELSDQTLDIYNMLKGKHPLANSVAVASKKLKKAATFLKEKKGHEAFNEEDEALNLLIKLRDNLIKNLSKMKPSNSSCDKVQDALTELALDVDMLIIQEKDVLKHYEQYMSNTAEVDQYFNANSLQSKSIVDAGELKSALEIHPDGTPLNITRLNESITLMKQANSKIESQDSPIENINQTIVSLEELAQHLRGLDEVSPKEALKKAKQIAKKAAKELEKQAKEKKSIGKKDTKDKKKEDPKKKKPSKKKPEKKPREKPGAKSGVKSGSKPGDKPGDKPGNIPGESMDTEQMARQVEMIKDWLNNIANKETDTKDTDAKANKERAKKLIEEAQLDQLIKDLKKVGENPTPIELDRLAKKMNALSDILKREELNLTMSKLDRLTKAKKLAQSIMDSKEDESKKTRDLIELVDMLNNPILNKQKDGLKGLDNKKATKDIVATLNKLIEELLKNKIDTGSDVQVPSKYKHLVEEYFKVLSDDIDDDSKN